MKSLSPSHFKSRLPVLSETTTILEFNIFSRNSLYKVFMKYYEVLYIIYNM